MFRMVVPALLALVYPRCFADAAPDTSHVRVAVLVTTEKGAPVTSLTQENFRLFEDKTEQRITGLRVDHGPVSLGILVDTSGSMTAGLAATAHGVASVLSAEVRGDEFFLLEFAKTAQVTVPFTGDSEKIVQRVAQARPGGRTSLLDAIDLGLRELQHARNPRRAMVIFSDGADNASRSSDGAVRKSLSESDVAVFVVGLFHPHSLRSPALGEIEAPHLLGKLTHETGGELYWPERLDALVRLGYLVATELHTRYVLSYSPAHSLTDGKRRHIKITLTSPRDMGRLYASYRQTTQ
ncbi:MAG: VWA domain-containing protein [Bryobacteraceae bacterium]|jgi:Ca-activated chloride channel family protein